MRNVDIEFNRLTLPRVESAKMNTLIIFTHDMQTK